MCGAVVGAQVLAYSALGERSLGVVALELRLHRRLVHVAQHPDEAAKDGRPTVLLLDFGLQHRTCRCVV